MTTTLSIDRAAAIDAYRRNRLRSDAIFDVIDPSAYYSRPIALRNPIVFYEGHLPAFSVIAFLRRGLNRPAVDARLEQLFARGIDPETEVSAVPRSGASTVWPSRREVQAFGRACDEAILDALAHEALPAEGLYTALEHEAMHQETLLYMWHRLPYEQKRRPRDGEWRHLHSGPPAESPAAAQRIHIPAGRATLGASRSAVVFGWDNEFDAHVLDVAAFDVDALPVTNGRYLDFVDAGGYRARELWDADGWDWIEREHVEYPAFWVRQDGQWLWRGMFEQIPLPANWPVYVSQAEAAAYSRWKGARLMTEPEFHRAAYGTLSGTERAQPWGDAAPDAARGHFDFAGFDPVPAGTHLAGASAWGVHELVGNGWEWTSTVFGPFPGFRPMASYPEYSADFFDGQHYVMKGASSATASALVRRSFRNWFRGNYPYVYAKFRTVRS